MDSKQQAEHMQKIEELQAALAACQKRMSELEQLRADGLRESERRFSDSFHASPLPLTILNFENGIRAEINKGFAALFGYSQQELDGDFSENNLAVDESKFQEVIEKLNLEGHLEDHPLQMLTKNGEIRDILASASQIGSKKERQYIIAYVDITERKQLEAEIRTSRDRLKTIAQKVIATQENERQRISRELHDDIGQSLTAININLELLSADMPPEAVPLSEQIDETVSLVQASLDNLRNLAHQLRPPVLDTIGLNTALKNLCIGFGESNEIAIQYQGAEIEGISDLYQVTFYRFAQEALLNVQKHAFANNLTVRLDTKGQYLVLEIRDDGIGFDIQKIMGNNDDYLGDGMKNMRERLELVGGELEIRSIPGEGTILTGMVPIISSGDDANA